MGDGGGFQATESFETPKERPGWAQRVVEAGYAALVVARPGQGHSPPHTDIMEPPLSYESGRAICFPPDPSGAHSQWPLALPQLWPVELGSDRRAASPQALRTAAPASLRRSALQPVVRWLEDHVGAAVQL